MLLLHFTKGEDDAPTGMLGLEWRHIADCSSFVDNLCCTGAIGSNENELMTEGRHQRQIIRDRGRHQKAGGEEEAASVFESVT